MDKQPIRAGFTLIELMITIAIVGILAAVAIPSYINYTDKARFSEVIQAVAALKPIVAQCVMTQNGPKSCDNGTNGIPAAPAPTGNIASVTVVSGVITGTGGNKAPSDTYILTPEFANYAVTWTVSGTCQVQGSC